jgi:hypothetical protein
MRLFILATALALSACASPPIATSSTTLVSADASTALIAGERLALRRSERPGGDGQDPAVALSLQRGDGRLMSFQALNHAPHHVAAQAPGGPLAQIMGLFGEEQPLLYAAAPADNRGAPFICGPEGPANIGVHEAADGSVQLVGLKQDIQFETRPDGRLEAVPYSPDQVCARLRFTRG